MPQSRAALESILVREREKAVEGYYQGAIYDDLEEVIVETSPVERQSYVAALSDAWTLFNQRTDHSDYSIVVFRCSVNGGCIHRELVK
jgi:hypothetical protein